ncbi:MAG: hypothetical protein ACTSQL_01045 [Promethearchaeota archaeon]
MAKNKRKQHMRTCSRCKKREWTSSESEFCKDCYLYERTKKVRKERRKNKCCACCGKKVKPKIIITYRCESCMNKIRSKKQSETENQSKPQSENEK